MNKEVEFFESFVHTFDMNNKKIKHKYDHTYRVLNYMKIITKSLDLDEKEYNRACVCALFHDLGRFPQIRDYDTFIDRESFDHGDRSFDILKEINLVDYTDVKEAPISNNLFNYIEKSYLINI